MKKYFLIASLPLLLSCDYSPDRNEKLFGYQDGISVDEDKATNVPPLAETSRPRMLIKTGNLSMKVTDLKDARKKIGIITENLSAYISEEQLNNFGDRINISLVIRVPYNQYDSLFNSIERVGRRTDGKSVSVQDVTEDYIDTEARLKTKMELEARYREILKNASTVTDILAVESQLNTVRGEIESMQGRLKYLGSQVSFSTLHLNFYQATSVDFGFAGKLVSGLKNGWENLLSFFIGIVNVWPFIILITGSVWIFRRWRKNRSILVKPDTLES